MNKRMVVVSDFHAGHEYGLCPPCSHRRAASSKTGEFEESLWLFYAKAIDQLKPIDILLVNGDCIEGKGESSGGVELLTTDRHDQAEIAAEAIRYTEAEAVRIMYGTRRHVGKEEDFESVIIDKLKSKNAKIQGHGFFDVNGRKVDVKHKVSGSTIPHGRMTPLAKAVLWNKQWSSEGRQPKGEIFIRSHVHYFAYCGGIGWIAMSTPALTYNSHFGVRECEGLVDVGIVAFDFNEKGDYTWWPIPAEFAELKVKPESL